MIDETAIRSALVEVIDPEIRRSVVELDMVRAVDVRGSAVDVRIALTVAGCPMKGNLEQQVRSKVGAVAGVEAVAVSFDVMTPEERQALRMRLQGGGGGRGREARRLDRPAHARDRGRARARAAWASRP